MTFSASLDGEDEVTMGVKLEIKKRLENAIFYTQKKYANFFLKSPILSCYFTNSSLKKYIYYYNSNYERKLFLFYTFFFLKTEVKYANFLFLKQKSS